MNNPKKILLAHLFSNGDCLYATAVARQIKADYPGCKLTWAIAGFCQKIIDNNPYVDEVIVTDEAPKNNVPALRKYKRKVLAEKAAGIWDEVFVTTNMDTNLAFYDGTIRGMVLRAYPSKITVPLQPVLQLRSEETAGVDAYAQQRNIRSFKNVILWEYAPLSGQVDLNFDMVMGIAKRLVQIPATCVILSSANKFPETDNIFDASSLSVRQNAGLTHFCTLLIGCSSGITWLTTSSAAKFLPMLQLLNPYTTFINTPSVDFKRHSIVHNGLIEMGSFTDESVYACVETILTEGFPAAEKFNQEIPLQFKTTTSIVYNLLVYREFAAIKRHLRIMKSIYGSDPRLLKAYAAGFTGFPLKLIKNVWKKRIARNKR